MRTLLAAAAVLVLLPPMTAGAQPEPPGSADVAMYAGQTGEGYTGMLPTDGDYKVRV